MEKNKIVIKGARTNNLKNIDLTIPRNKLVVFTGLSGSGKSSLAFDTIFAEGQRRYVESLSSYARQFLGQVEKPDVDSIDGLSPAISIDQKTTNNNPRSTVGTVTEIYDYLRLLFSRLGTPHCPKCGKVIQRQTVDQICDKIMELPERTKIQLLAPVVRNRKGEHVKIFEDAKKSGYVRVRVDGNVYDLSEHIELDKNIKHSIEIIIDRLVIKEGMESRLTQSIESVMALSGGLLIVDVIGGEELLFSQSFACPDCGISIEDIEPSKFSFNNPSGACPKCMGLGVRMVIDEGLVVPNKNLSLKEGAIVVSGWGNITSPESPMYSVLKALMSLYKFDLTTPYKDLPVEVTDALMYGTHGYTLKVPYKVGAATKYYDLEFEGIIPNIERRYKESSSDVQKEDYESYMTNIVCPDCNGMRLKPEILSVTIKDKNIAEVSDMSIKDIKKFFDDFELTESQKIVGTPILKEIQARIGFLCDVGLDYLSLSRTSGTLSGGESQRIRLATQIGSGLMGVLYILDEPSIGLHQRDNDKLLSTLKNLRDLDNSLIVVEHDEDTMKAADYIVDVGPYAGAKGGEIVFQGTYNQILKSRKSITGKFLSGRERIEIPSKRREGNGEAVKIIGASQNNLKNVDVDIPLGKFICVTGVSGSGKSSLINEILYKALARKLNRAKIKPGKYKEILGYENLDKIINIDQSPIGRTPRSNPATYTGLFDLIRDVFAQTQDAKVRGYEKGRFSFNIKGGRCEACSGDGILKIEMHFLPDVFVPCEVCGGKRYNRETLEVKFKGKTIADVLDMTIDEAYDFFINLPKLKNKLETLKAVGLGYVKLGQSSTTLSGGEAQRVKLATELSKRSTGKTIYVLDEPTTGLHAYDVRRLIDILQRLTDAGNTVVVIEHNLDLIKTCDHIIDLGPEGGDGGGTIIAQGTPEEICNVKESYTGKYLRKFLTSENEL